MIINATGAGGGAQIIKFTVSSNTDINVNFYIVSNVKIPRGKVTGFFLSALGGTVIGNMALTELFRITSVSPATSGQVQAILYKTATTSYGLYSNQNSSFEYDADAQEFKFKVSAYDVNAAYIPAGNYQLVVW